MNKVLSFSLMFLTLCRCGDCDDCGDLSANISKYGFVNSLDKSLTVIVHGEGQTLEFDLHPNDTSDLWERVLLPPPGGSSNPQQFFTMSENTSNSFPFNSSSVSILLKGKVLKNYIREGFFTEADWQYSVYLDESPPYTISVDEKTGIGFHYYKLDSLNLELN